MKIYTRQIIKDWYCYATVNGYDHQFKNADIKNAQSLMEDFLKANNITEYEFAEPEPYVYPKKETKPPVTYAKNRIDNL